MTILAFRHRRITPDQALQSTLVAMRSQGLEPSREGHELLAQLAAGTITAEAAVGATLARYGLSRT